MSPLYHLQVGSFVAAARNYTLRERRMIMLAALAPDLDGIFFWNAALWESMHHTFSHNVYFVLLVSVAFALYNRARRLELIAVCFVTGFVQMILDAVTNDPSWKQRFFWPLSEYDFALGNFIEWDGLSQFLVWGVQGTLMVAILAGTVILYIKKDRTFLELVSPRFDSFITDFIVFAFSKKCAVCGKRAYYRDVDTGEPLCPEHSKIKKNLTVERASGKDGPDD